MSDATPEQGTLPPEDAPTIPASNPPASIPRQDAPELPLPEELSALLPPGAYHVERFLGQGGMGAVYKGVQVRLKRPVAIKIMRRDQGRDYGFEQRFEREAQAMAKLNHPNIVSVIDYGEAGPDYLYIVMELIDGADMMDLIRTGRMTQEMALMLLPQICDALQFAHDHGIVHRDIKPSNIMLTRDGRIKMADFGLAKRFDVESSFRTQTGTSMGTPDYAAPEQFDAHAQIDHRADIYALGVMIYQMITGQLPRGVWKPPSQRAEIAPEWDDIVAHAMQADPKDRYQAASDVKTDVSKITPPGEGRAAAPSAAVSVPAATNRPKAALARASALPKQKSRAPLVFGVVGTVVILAVGAFFALRRDRSNVRQDVAEQPLGHALASAAANPKQTLDLLAHVDVQRDRMKAQGNAGANQWKKEGGQLAFASADGLPGKIGAPVSVNGLGDYEVEVGVPEAEGALVVLDFPISPSSQATLSFMPGQGVTLRADEKGQQIELGAWPKTAARPPWKLAGRVKLDADGVSGTLTATINGQPAGEWRGLLSRLGRRPEPHPEFPGQFVPSLFIVSAMSTHSSWMLRVFEGEAKVLRGAASQPASPPLAESGWQPLFTDAEWKRSDAHGEFKDGLKHLQGAQWTKPQSSPDGAIRARFEFREDTRNPSVVMRLSVGQALYKLELSNPPVFAYLRCALAAKDGDVGKYAIPKPPQPGEMVELELRVQGDHLIGKLNGETVIDARDSRVMQAGEWGVNANDGWYESVEVQTLGVSAATVTAAAAPESGAIRIDDQTADLSKSDGVRWEGGAFHVGPYERVNYDALPSRDMIVRASIQMVAGSQAPQLDLRKKKKAEDFYRVVIQPHLSRLDVEAVRANKATRLHMVNLPRRYAQDEWVGLEAKVIGDEISVSADGQPVCTVKDSSLSEPGGMMLFAMANGVFRDVVYVPLDKAPAATSPALEPGAIRLWHNAVEVAKSKHGKWENEALALGGGRGDATFYFDQPNRDMLFRASLRMNPEMKNAILRIRAQGIDGKDGYYKMGPSQDRKNIALSFNDQGQQAELGQWPLPRTYGPDEWMRLELHAIGEELTVFVDGDKLGTVRDNRLLKPGGVGLWASASGASFFRDVVYVPLDKSGSSGVPPSAPSSDASRAAEKWSDRIAEEPAMAPFSNFEDDGAYIQTPNAKGGPSIKANTRDGAIRITWKLTALTTACESLPPDTGARPFQTALPRLDGLFGSA